MKLARVLATGGCQNSASALPGVDSLSTSSSMRDRAMDSACCNASDRAYAAASTNRDDHWSCGVCYEEVCCPFSLPCGHTVCGSCLQQLLQFHARCPFCRLSVFQGCTFGRNVAMWNAIKARHPTEAARLASSSTVNAYQLPSPSKRAMQQDTEQTASQSAQILQSPRHSSAEELSEAYNASAPLINRREPELLEDSHSSPGFGLDWPALLQLSARLRAAQAPATSSTGFTDSSANVPLHQNSVRSRSSPVHSVPTAGSPHAEAVPGAISAPVSQPEVLRRAQASFADLRRIVQNVLTLGDNTNDPANEPASSDTSAPPTAVLAGINQVRTALWSRLATTAQAQSVT